MGRLSNELLRRKSMLEFLTAMGINIKNLDVTSVEGLFCYKLENADAATQFANKLNEIVKEEGSKQTVSSISLSQIIKTELQNATTDDVDNLAIHRASCAAILSLIEQQNVPFTFCEENGIVEVTLPNPVYAPLLNLLHYSNLSFSNDGKLVFDIKKFLKTSNESVITLDGFNPIQPPLVFLNAKALAAKQMFYATKVLADKKVEVTPYFFVPEAPQAPIYHIVIDVSGSMEEKLAELKINLVNLLEELFNFLPDAKVSLSTFSEVLTHLGEYDHSKKDDLLNVIEAINVENETALYNTTLDFMKKLKTSEEHNNVLLFTDGEDTCSNPDSLNLLDATVQELGKNPSLTTVRNKYYVFSYGATQCALIHDVTKAFRSSVIETNSLDFLNAQKDPEFMKKWAAARDLFTARFVVQDQTSRTESSYNLELDMSGQLASLQTRVCKQGEELTIKIEDSKGKVVNESFTRIGAQNNAQILSKMGFMKGVGETQEQSYKPVSHGL